LLVLSCVCGSAHAQTGSSTLVAPKLEDDDGNRIPYSLGFKLESSVGQGSFVADEYARNSLVVWGASIAPGYRPTDELTLSAYAKVIQELTDSDTDNQRQQLQLGDVALRSDYSLGTIPVIDVKAATGLWASFPTSDASQFETLVVGLSARLVLGRTFGEHFSLDYLGIFRKNFHEYESPVLDADQSGTPPVFIRPGGAEDLGGTAVALGQNNTSFYVYNLLGLTWMPVAKGAWSFSIAYAMTNAFTYASFERDELSSPYADDGPGQRDSAAAVLDVGYELDKRFAFSAGITTSSAPKSEDNQSFRFPFYDFEGAAANHTVFYLDMTIREPIGD
jgi:hypothetical protein